MCRTSWKENTGVGSGALSRTQELGSQSDDTEEDTEL